MEGRHEVKHYISLSDYYELRTRLRTVLYPDCYAGKDGTYRIRSLYFDSADDKALREKLDGVQNRDKFRIRLYNEDCSCIHLEKKSKRGSVCYKDCTCLSAEECLRLLDGDCAWMEGREDPLIREFRYRIRTDGLRPQTIVDYIRDPFVYPAGNVRVTLDHDIRTGLRSTDFLNRNCPTIPVVDDAIILEVKWDRFLPDLVKDAVQVPSRSASAYSKYAACRAYDF